MAAVHSTWKDFVLTAYVAMICPSMSIRHRHLCVPMPGEGPGTEWVLSSSHMSVECIPEGGERPSSAVPPDSQIGFC